MSTALSDTVTPMSGTSLFVDSTGRVRLLEGHLWRLGEEHRETLLAQAVRLGPGTYRADFIDGALTLSARPPSALHDGMPTRVMVSPYAGQTGKFAKPSPGSQYESVRKDGVATLLTDASGTEFLESDRATLIGWDGEQYVLTPRAAAGVASVAERAVMHALPHRFAQLLVTEQMPLLLINAVVGTCAPSIAGRGAFPDEPRRRLDHVLR